MVGRGSSDFTTAYDLVLLQHHGRRLLLLVRPVYDELPRVTTGATWFALALLKSLARIRFSQNMARASDMYALAGGDVGELLDKMATVEVLSTTAELRKWQQRRYPAKGLEIIFGRTLPRGVAGIIASFLPFPYSGPGPEALSEPWAMVGVECDAWLSDFPWWSRLAAEVNESWQAMRDRFGVTAGSLNYRKDEVKDFVHAEMRDAFMRGICIPPMGLSGPISDPYLQAAHIRQQRLIRGEKAVSQILC